MSWKNFDLEKWWIIFIVFPIALTIAQIVGAYILAYLWIFLEHIPLY